MNRSAPPPFNTVQTSVPPHGKPPLRLADVFSRSHYLAGGLGTAIALVMMALTLWTLYRGRTDALEHARESAMNVVALVSNDVQRNFEVSDLSLRAIAEGAANPRVMALPAGLRDQILFDRATTAQYLGGAFVIDASGRITIAEDGDVSSDFRASDRDYFVAQQNDTARGLFISHPYQARHRNNSWSIALSRRIDGANGSFAGIAVIAIRLPYFDALLQRVSTGHTGSVFIIDSSGTLIARAPYLSGDTGRSFGLTPTLQRMRASPSGAFMATAALDQVRRLYVFTHIPGTPFIAVMAPGEDDVLAHWRQRSLVVGTLALLLGASFILISWYWNFALWQRALANATLLPLAMTDPLTGLSNRRTLDLRLEEEWRRAMRGKTALSCLFIDIDHFKAYNDRYGHEQGDAALIAVARCIEAMIRRPGDSVARYGGEEFVVLLPDTPGEGAALMAEAIRTTVERHVISHEGEPASHLTVSIGCATLRPADASAMPDLLEIADQALYAAKEGGRNRVDFAPA